MLIKSGDTVEIRTGNAKGTRAKVLSVLEAKDSAGGHRLVVEGVNRVYRHIRRSQKNPQGGRLSKEMPIDASNVSPVVDGKPTRVRFVTKPDGSKSRVAARGGKELHQLHGPRKK